MLVCLMHNNMEQTGICADGFEHIRYSVTISLDAMRCLPSSHLNMCQSVLGLEQNSSESSEKGRETKGETMEAVHSGCHHSHCPPQ